MSITALQICDAAFADANVIGEGESVADAGRTALGTDGLARLNNLVKVLNNQRLVSSFQAREVFPLVADQALYTIGPGGDFDTTRPFTLDGAAVLQNPTIGSATTITAASVTNGTFTVAGDETDAFTSGTKAIVSGSTTGLDGSYTVIDAIFSVSTVIRVLETVASAVLTGSPTIQAFTQDNSTIEIPRPCYTNDAWQGIQIKSMTNQLATGVYFMPQYALGRAAIFLWPVPNVATNAIVLYRRNVLATFSSLTATYDVPPGFEELLQYNLAKRLLTPYAITDQNVRGDVLRMAASSLATVKRTNAVSAMTDQPIDPAYTHDRRGYYNINVSNY